MLFEKVKEEHILKGIKDFEEKGFPEGFGSSSTYDLVYKNKTYPPKAIMAYANYYASGRKIERYFKGGLDTRCFKAFERNGFKIEKKKHNMNLKEEFKQWLNKNFKNSSGAKSSYVRAIELLEKPLGYDVFSTIDIDKLNLLYQDLLEKQTDINSKYYNANIPSYGKDRYYSAGIAKYIEFIKDKNKSSNEKFTWVKTHLAITSYLADKKNDQLKLIDILKNAGVTGFSDRDFNNVDIDLEVIDPFTFFCYIYKYGGSRRLQILQSIAKQINIHYPNDECGIPSSNAQKVWLFPYKESRVNNEIERLWSFFFQALKDEINNDSFEDLLEIRGIARTKLTEALFNINPKKYFPINGPTKPYLNNVFNINPKFKTFEDYKNILNQLQSKTNKPFYQLSYEAWLWNEEQKNNKTMKNNTISSLKEEYIEYLDGYAYSTIEIYSTNFVSYLEFYADKKNISTFNHENFIELSKVSRFEFGRKTPFEHKGKGYSNFTTFFNEKSTNKRDSNSIPLNQILYGPPGTGKTYKTKEIAVNIALGKEERSRIEILSLYEELLTEGQINFTTFHQSMSYEDFVEGIKPIMNEDEETLRYQIQKGIFKKIADKSKGISGTKQQDNSIDFSKSNYFKMSIGGKHRIELHNWCIENNLVALGWGDNEDYSAYISNNNWQEFRDKFKKEFPYLVENSKYHIQAMFIFQKMNIGDIVLISLGNHILDAVGVIESGYEYDAENKYGFHHYRKVKWLATNMNASPEIFIDKGISQQSIYEFDKQDVKIESIKEFFSTPEEALPLNHVLIIDEINRGNISSIFGELITLLEEDKRSGKDEEIEVILPYSKEPFKVPSNLFIVGTMNTADRSIEALDTALRRRFSFTEIAPNPKLLASKKIEEIELEKLLLTINDRIELLIDKDHKIGHSYFLNIETLEELKQAFKNNVIPLLEEYFFGDYGKIGLVLGNNFIKPQENDSKVSFAKNFTEKYEDAENLREKAIYTFTDEDSWKASSFISIYEQ